MIREASPTCRALIKEFEGLKDGDLSTPNLDPYMDHIGVWTIGWGHAIHVGSTLLRGPADAARAKALYPDGITIAQAEILLAADLLEKCRDVCSLVTRELSQSQFDALVDFCFNLGRRRLQESTLLKRVNAGDDVAAAQEFGKWIYAGTPPKPANGLIRRRAFERALWEGKQAA
jgi:lysozyme